MKKIVLFDSNVGYIGVPLALLSITKLLDTKKYDIRIITKTEFPDFEKEILAQCKDALCFGVTCITGKPITTALRVSRLVKENYPSVPIIWGGWQPITLPNTTLANPNIDYICTGQGERTFFEFINMLEKKDLKNVSKIDGLSYKQNGKIFHNSAREIENLNNFPDFNLDFIEWERYLELTDYGTKGLRIITSYGCPHRCGFCCEPYSSKRTWKPLSAERVIGFLKELRSRVNFDGLIIVDSNFFVHEQRVAGICKGLIDNNFKLKFGQVNGRTSGLTRYKDETWQLLKQAGLYNILIGAESGSDATLKLINKDAKVEDTYLLSKICKTNDIKLVISTIIGLPISSYFGGNQQEAFDHEFAEILKLYKDLFKLDSNNRILTFPFTPLPFSQMYNKAIELGFNPPSDLEEWSKYNITDVHINWLSEKNLRKIDFLNYISVTIIDFKYLMKSLPLIVKIGSSSIISLVQAINKQRLKYQYFSFPVDKYLFMIGLRVFKAINRRLRIVNINN